MNKKFQIFKISTTAQINLLYKNIMKRIVLNFSPAFIKHQFYIISLHTLLGISSGGGGFSGKLPVQVKVCMRHIVVIHQHPADKGLGRHQGTDRVWTDLPALAIQRERLFPNPLRLAFQLWKDCPTRSGGNL